MWGNGSGRMGQKWIFYGGIRLGIRLVGSVVHGKKVWLFFWFHFLELPPHKIVNLDDLLGRVPTTEHSSCTKTILRKQIRLSTLCVCVCVSQKLCLCDANLWFYPTFAWWVNKHTRERERERPEGVKWSTGFNPPGGRLRHVQGLCSPDEWSESNTGPTGRCGFNRTIRCSGNDARIHLSTCSGHWQCA